MEPRWKTDFSKVIASTNEVLLLERASAVEYVCRSQVSKPFYSAIYNK